jgi:O-antigen ligase
MAVVAMAVVRRRELKRLIVAGLVIGVIGASPMVLLKENRDDLIYRVNGFISALFTPGGEDDRPECVDTKSLECDREIRVLFIKQGTALWAERPVLGYGVGQFGGFVAFSEDPNWNMDQRFQEVLGPQGFDLHDFKSTSVDVFWLHLLVEVGALGVIAYLAWMYLIGAPLVSAARKHGHEPRDGIFLWSVGALVFAVLIATWSASLEDPLFPPMLFGVLGFGWVLLWSRPASAASAAVTTGDEDTVRPERRR